MTYNTNIGCNISINISILKDMRKSILNRHYVRVKKDNCVICNDFKDI
jgi:hypothetical protein